MQAFITRSSKKYPLGTYANKAQKLFIENSVKTKVPISSGKSRECWDEEVASALELAIVEAKNEFGDKFERKLPRVASKTSDIVGVMYNAKQGSWNVRIYFQNNTFLMGSYFKTEEDAAYAHAIAKEVFFKDMKDNPSDEEIQESAALAKSKAYEVVIGNIHDEKTPWKCECGLIHSGERKKCQIYEGHSSADFMEGRSEGCGRFRGGHKPLKKKRKKVKKVKKVEPINMSEEVTVIVPARRKILTVLSSYGGNVGMTAEDIINKIYEDYKDERIVESLIDAKLDALVTGNVLMKVDDVYLLVEPAPPLVHPSLLTVTAPVATKEETSIVPI